MRAYLMRLVCAAILCAIVEALAGSGTGSGVRRLTAGIFLTLTAFSLPGSLELPDFDALWMVEEAKLAAEDGAAQAASARADIIIEQCCTYAESKAAALGLTVSAQVELDERGWPCRLLLRGAASPEERRALLESLELGLGEEDVIWMQPYQSSE